MPWLMASMHMGLPPQMEPLPLLLLAWGEMSIGTAESAVHREAASAEGSSSEAERRLVGDVSLILFSQCSFDDGL